MKRCPITYQKISTGKYSVEGLHSLSKKLEFFEDFPFTPKEQIKIAEDLVLKLSIQGVQPKLSVKLNIKNKCFEVVNQNGTFILKPPHHVYEELPQNEDLTMKLAKLAGIDVPLSGLIYNCDKTLSYFIKRFDRGPKKTKYPVEDFSQLLGFDRDRKYDASIEKLICAMDEYCTFPIQEKIKLFKIIIFNFLIGNEDMHLKNYSLITMEGVTKLRPAYDLINTSIAFKATEETALYLNGKKSNLKKIDLIDYLGMERLQLNWNQIESVLIDFNHILPYWKSMVAESFLSKEKQRAYLQVLENRIGRIFK
ncbi:MAG: type II toxin-antitoxin system HipA family toxin [Chlamydiae bacterium]|nr:type II toxin-antitoxin system HipA family toxin [Chlamydiota bacterium]